RGLREAATLTRELAAFRMKPSSSAADTLDAWRERDQDDQVLAVALAVWLGEFGPPPEMNIIHRRLDPRPAARALVPQVVFPEVRYFAPHDSFQPLLRIDGETLVGCPDFRTQQQAAYFRGAASRAGPATAQLRRDRVKEGSSHGCPPLTRPAARPPAR